MMLAGIRVRETHGIELARLLQRSGYWDTSEKLLDAYNEGIKVLGLTIAEREQILRVLDDPPDFLAELRGVLLREHEGRLRDGLV
jgi:hypothetical protein